jgi:hypothetical protein
MEIDWHSHRTVPSICARNRRHMDSLRAADHKANCRSCCEWSFASTAVTTSAVVSGSITDDAVVASMHPFHITVTATDHHISVVIAMADGVCAKKRSASRFQDWR